MSHIWVSSKCLGHTFSFSTKILLAKVCDTSHIDISSAHPNTPPFLVVLGVASAYLLVPKIWNPWKSTPGSKELMDFPIFGKICFNLRYEISWNFCKKIDLGGTSVRETLRVADFDQRPHQFLPLYLHKSDCLMTCSLEMKKHGTSRLSLPALQISSGLNSPDKTRERSSAFPAKDRFVRSILAWWR